MNRERREKKDRLIFIFHRLSDSRWWFTSAVLRSDRSSFKRFMSSFFMCLGDSPTSCLTYGVRAKTGWYGNLTKPANERHAPAVFRGESVYPATKWFQVNSVNSQGLSLNFLQGSIQLLFNSLPVRTAGVKVQQRISQKKNFRAIWQKRESQLPMYSFTFN